MPWGVKCGTFKGKGIYNFTGDVSMSCANVSFFGRGEGDQLRSPIDLLQSKSRTTSILLVVWGQTTKFRQQYQS